MYKQDSGDLCFMIFSSVFCIIGSVHLRNRNFEENDMSYRSDQFLFYFRVSYQTAKTRLDFVVRAVHGNLADKRVRLNDDTPR